MSDTDKTTLSENVLEAARDFVWNVEHNNVAGWGDCSRDVQCDASFRELKTALAEYAHHIAGANKMVERIVRRETDPACQSCLEGLLKRGDAWLCDCGQINGYHNSRCCHCDKTNDTPCQ